MGTLQFWGPLAVGNNQLPPLVLPHGTSIGIVYAALEKAPTGQAVRIQLQLDGIDVGPVIELPAWIFGEPVGSGVVFSGSEYGTAGGMGLSANVLQVGSADPGENLTIYVTV
jgi:hypothetical protein